MKTLAYLDCVTGIAGDMCLGALVHLGVPLAYLTEQLARLGIGDEFSLRAERVQRNAQVATKVFVDLTGHQSDHSAHKHSNRDDRIHQPDHVHQSSSQMQMPSDDLPAHHGGRRLLEIEALIEKADLPVRATAWSLAVFRLLAKAEAAVHGIPPEQVHFHEVGATDAIVDIVGTCLGLDWLDIDGLVCSPLPTGGGMVRCEHGLLPVPAPAVLSMMAAAQIPVYGNGIERELVTPTGCAIAATLSGSFGPPPRFMLQKIGLGAGGRDLKLPNILRLWIGTVDELPASARMKSARIKAEGAASDSDRPLDDLVENLALQTSAVEDSVVEDKTAKEIVALQTQLDDLSPQVVGYVFDLLFAAGAVDVFAQSVLMKKNRPGTLLTVLCPRTRADACERVLFCETTTLGIRRSEQRRSVLSREMVTVETTYGALAVKVGRLLGEVMNVQPEFEDCAKVARSHQIPLQQVQRAAMAAADHLWGDR